MWAGLDLVVKEVWEKLPYLSMVQADQIYLVHFGKYCWTSSWSGFAFPLLFRYDLFETTQRPFELKRRTITKDNQPISIDVSGIYEFKDVKALTLDLGYVDFEHTFSSEIGVKVSKIVRKSNLDELDFTKCNRELLSFARHKFSKYVDWKMLDMSSIVNSIPIDVINFEPPQE